MDQHAPNRVCGDRRMIPTFLIRIRACAWRAEQTIPRPRSQIKGPFHDEALAVRRPGALDANVAGLLAAGPTDSALCAKDLTDHVHIQQPLDRRLRIPDRASRVHVAIASRPVELS